MSEISKKIAAALSVTDAQVIKTIELLDAGNTVPFIARYRKEMTQGLDEEQILFIEKRRQYELTLAQRQETVLKQIEAQGRLTPEIRAAVLACRKLSEVEDLYRPYVQKKKTRAALAMAAGLEPLADWLAGCPAAGDIEAEAQKYLSDKIGDPAMALQGARDILAERIADAAKLRWKFKEAIERTGILQTKVRKGNPDEKRVYQMYYDRKERLGDLAAHRIMAIDRAEKEKVLTVSFSYGRSRLEDLAAGSLIRGRRTIAQGEIEQAARDGCERLLFPSIEREIRSELTEKAQRQSIEVFSGNLERLLLQPPLKGRVVLGFDPAFRTGCKLAVLDETGKLLKIAKIYPHQPVNHREEAARELARLVKDYAVATIAIGNGTASRESEQFVADTIREYGLKATYAIVSEAGASVYSASDEARAEFPDLAVEERSAVSIGRRLLDPLPELIKIDPKSIGVGQYQHDLPEKELNERLDEAVMKCVNRVGCDLNTASVELLTHISGLTRASARAIVEHRNENGRYQDRRELLKVRKLGAKTFEQCAGFLRISGGKEPLDQTAVHPESYPAAKALMRLCGITELGRPDAAFPADAAARLGIDSYTLQDIESAIQSPLRDYRDQYEGALLRSDVLEISDLKVGQELSGTVRNVVDFGAFVDIGLHSDGLVHVSRMGRGRAADPQDIVAVGDIVEVWVAGIDAEKGRVQLSLVPVQA